VAVSVLRRALREQGLNGVIVTTPGGYRLTLAGDELDADIFDRHVEAARVSTRCGDHEESARQLRAALRLWRGQALADITAAYAQPARQQLHERRLAAQELLVDAELTLGHHDTLIPELGRLVEEHPLRERLTCPAPGKPTDPIGDPSSSPAALLAGRSATCGHGVRLEKAVDMAGPR
jgi:DNA-binding SARP family transcriptional activator